MSPELGFPGDPGRLVNDGIVIPVHVGGGGARETDGQGRYLSPRRALIDTGAADCFVDVGLAQELDLKKIDRQQTVTGVTGKRLTVDVYSTRIHIDPLDITLLDPCPSYPLRTMGGPFDVILGRNFLLRVRMSYDGSSGSVHIASPLARTG